MNLDEFIKKMYTQFTFILNELKGLGKKLSNEELVNKILRSLPTSQEAKMVAIEEAEDLTKLTIKEIIDFLTTHEIKVKK